jgi:hypothetical protein
MGVVKAPFCNGVPHKGYCVKLSCWNLYNFDLEADAHNMPDILWLSQFFEGLEPELRPIFECLIEVEYAEQYEPEPTIREYLKNPTLYKIEKFTFSSISNYYWVYHFKLIIEAYQIAKREFKKKQKPKNGGDLKTYEAVKKFFDEH